MITTPFVNLCPDGVVFYHCVMFASGAISRLACEAVALVQDIMQQAMQQCTPDIPIRTSAKLASTWEH